MHNHFADLINKGGRRLDMNEDWVVTHEMTVNRFSENSEEFHELHY